MSKIFFILSARTATLVFISRELWQQVLTVNISKISIPMSACLFPRVRGDNCQLKLTDATRCCNQSQNLTANPRRQRTESFSRWNVTFLHFLFFDTDFRTEREIQIEILSLVLMINTEVTSRTRNYLKARCPIPAQISSSGLPRYESVDFGSVKHI